MRVDFYQLAGRFDQPIDVACVLVGKAWPEAREIAIVGRADQLAALDDRLWERPAGRFLPHAIDDQRAPIRLLEQAPESAELLINLDPHGPLPSAAYPRVLEIVPQDESLKQQMRRRWRDWKARDAALHHHVLK